MFPLHQTGRSECVRQDVPQGGDPIAAVGLAQNQLQIAIELCHHLTANAAGHGVILGLAIGTVHGNAHKITVPFADRLKDGSTFGAVGCP